MNKDIHCDECHRFLFSTTTESWGAIGCEAQHKGFIYKIPILYTDKYERLIFCAKECQKIFYDKHIPKNEKVNEVLNDMKKQIPDMAKNVSAKMAKLVDYISENRLTNQLLKWGNSCCVDEKRDVNFDQLYSNFEKDFNPAKGQTQKGEFDEWIEKFKNGKFFTSERSFDIYIDQAYRTICFTRIK
ncbi:hypothetical protein [Dysgonomonas gadei]|uniref:hypothetical protein n=1 Tax=Dysgonomonas gadei TaxID=156974 RepID=UPI003AF18827